MRAKLVLAAACRGLGAATAITLGAGQCSCQSILGIEDLSEDPRPLGRADAPGGSSGVGSGGNGRGGNGASPGGGVNPGGGGNAGMAAGGGASGMQASSDADSGAAPSGTIAVTGKVIDFFRRPVPDVPITIGQQSALTDDNGEFAIDGVAPPYDVSLIASSTQSDFAFRYYAYVYQGLTRPDPTLQVYYGLPERGSSLNTTLTGASFTDMNRRLIFAFSSPEGHYAASGINFETPTLSPSWSGPAATAGNAHGLLVLRASTATDAPPLSYEAYQTAPLALRDEVDSNITLDMTADVIPQVTLSGSVDAGGFGTPTHRIAARLADGTVLPLLANDSSQATFSYLVPALAGSSLIVAASASTPGFALAHADGVPAAPDQNVALELPRPVAPNAPAGGSDVAPGTLFSWSTLGQTTGVFVWHLESNDYFEGIYVVTSRSELEFPTVPGYSMVLPTPDNDFTFYWAVETHGDYVSVDAAAGPEGLFDSFALAFTMGTGPSRGSAGYYTNSDTRVVNVVSQ
jgi:hypothetical protein